MQPSLGSLFTGIGGFDLGFERAGFRTAWQVEIDRAASGVLARHWPDVARYTDVCDVDGMAMEPVDVIAFGSPCQDLSVAGQRRGLAGERSGLFFEAVRVIWEMRDATDGRCPVFALWENVPGAHSSLFGRDYGAALDALAECGAVEIAWRILDSQWLGLAQRRNRVFTLADFGGERAGEILTLAQSLRGDSPPSRAAGEDAPTGAVSGLGRGGPDDTRAQRGMYVPAVSHSLNAHGGPHGRIDGESETSLTLGFSGESDGSTARNVSNLARPITGRHGDPGYVAHTLRAEGFDRYNQAVTDGLSHSLRTSLGGDNNPHVLMAMTVRGLTPRECERLQGFPDDWTRYRADGKEQADGPRYRQLGNAVSVPVAEWIARNALEALKGG